MVSDKMIKTVTRYEHQHSHYDNGICEVLSNQGVAQAVVNAAWTEYNPNDETTWPNPSLKKEYYVIGTKKLTRTWFPAIPLVCDSLWKAAGVTHYADPNDLLNVRPESEVSDGE